MRSKYIHTLLVAVLATLSTGCHASASFTITPPGRVVSAVMGTNRELVTNMDKGTTFVDIIDECIRIHVRIPYGGSESINPRDVRCVFRHYYEPMSFVAKGYRVLGDSTLLIGAESRQFSPGATSYPWRIENLR